MRDDRAVTVDFSQRSRSFLFTSMAAITADLINVKELRVCDNGVVSINLPQSGQNYGSQLSRSTHPRFLSQAQDFLRIVTGRQDLAITNSLLFKTKKETLEIIASSGHPELLQETVSCAHVEGKTTLQPHCGVCTQCIDRRFASVAANLAQYDLSSRYEKDIFTSPLEKGIDRTHAENYVRFALKLEGLQNSDHFFETYGELYDCLPQDDDADSFAEAIWELFQRHQQEVNRVIEHQIQIHAEEIRRASLPEKCLLRIVSSGQPAVDLRVRYVEQLNSLLCKSIPAAFQTQAAVNERHVQDVGDTAFQAAQEELERESPQIPFGVVTTKPDYADTTPGEIPLFIEFKYINRRERLNSIHTEMSSRVTVYSDQGAWVLFIVYDPKRVITNDEKFVSTFTRHEGVHVGIVR